MTDPTFVQAGLADLDMLLVLIRAYYDFDGIPFNASEVGNGLRSLLGDTSQGQVWLIRASQNNVGYAILTYGFDLEFGGRVAIVTELYLTPEVRRQGFGTTTIRFLEKTCRDLGIGALELQVEHDNTEARAFYRRLGFHAHDRIPLSKLLRQDDRT